MYFLSNVNSLSTINKFSSCKNQTIDLQSNLFDWLYGGSIVC